MMIGYSPEHCDGRHNDPQLSVPRNLHVTRSDNQSGTAQCRSWLLRERAAQCAYHKCSLEAGIRLIGTMMTGVVTVIAITITGIGVTDGAAGTTRIGILGTDPLTKAPTAGLLFAPRRLASPGQYVLFGVSNLARHP